MDKLIAFQLEWNRGVGPIWHHDFSMASEAMAVDYTQRLLQANPELHHATRLQLWNVDSQSSLLYGTPKVVVTI